MFLHASRLQETARSVQNRAAPSALWNLAL